MIFTPLNIDGAYLIDIQKHGDERGFFGRIFCKQEFEKQGLFSGFVQGNMSYNRYKHTLRGLHYQLGAAAEDKLVRCTRGRLLDVIVDLRPNSPTRHQYEMVELPASSYQQIYVPKGVAHGFLTLEDNTEISYLVSAYYTPSAEGGIRWDDPFFSIPWPITTPTTLSSKDGTYPDYKA